MQQTLNDYEWDINAINKCHSQAYVYLWLICVGVWQRPTQYLKESLGLEKKIKTSKSSGLEKEDNDFKGPCWTTWLRGWQNWTLTPAPILQADCISLGPHPCLSALLNLPLLLSRNLFLNMKPPWSRMRSAWSLDWLSPLLAWIKVTCLHWGCLPFFIASSLTILYSIEDQLSSNNCIFSILLNSVQF